MEIPNNSLQLTRETARTPTPLARAPLLPGAPGDQGKSKGSCCPAPGKDLGESNLEEEAGLSAPGTSIHPMKKFSP